MSNRLKNPTDPEVLKEILSEISDTTREQWIERLSKYPDWDPAWANGDTPAHGEAPPNGAGNLYPDPTKTPAAPRS